MFDAVVGFILGMVELSLRDDPASHELLRKYATTIQVKTHGQIQDTDVLGYALKWIGVCLVCQGSGFGLGVMPLERLLRVFHFPLIALARKEAAESQTVPNEIAEFRRVLLKNWMICFNNLFTNRVQNRDYSQMELTVEKRSEVAFGFAKGSLPQV